MKKLFIPMTVLVFGLILLLSCGETGINEQSDSTASIIQICEGHNEGLEFIYNGLQESDDHSKPYEKISLLVEELIDMEYPDLSATSQNCFDNAFSKVQQYYDEITLSKNAGDSTSRSFYLNVLDELSDSLSAQQIDLLIDIHNTAQYNDIGKAIDSLDNIINVKLLLLPEEERHIVHLAAEMSKHSFSYWNDHIEEWYELFNSEESLGKRAVHIDWGSAGTTDVIVAISELAALGGTAAMAAFLLNPIGATAAAIAAGAIIVTSTVASAVDVVTQIQTNATTE